MQIIGGVQIDGGTKLLAPDSFSIVTTGLILHLDAGNASSYSGSGSTWTDLSPSAKNGTITGATYSSAESGYFSFAAASTNKVEVTSASAIWGLTNNITAEVWYTSTNNQPQLMSTGVSNQGFNFGRFTLNPTKFKVTKYNVVDIYRGDIPQNTNWHQAVVTFSSTTGVRVYVDGALSESLANNNNLIAGSRLTIGQAESGYHVGKISIVRMYNVALSASDVLQNFNANRSRYGI
jgi:hypothetical protein